MKFGSLFAGIGGIDLGLERAGMECIWQVENDDYCNRVLEKHWPEVQRFGDVRECTDLPPVDLIAGGFPCQPHSVAGKRRGAEDDRNLWPEYLRIIREVKPRYVLAENVPGIVTTYIDTVLFDLEGEGYTCATFNLPAVAFDAPHRRERIFIVAHASGDQLRNQSGRRSGQSRSNQAELGDNGAAGSLADSDRTRKLQPQRGEQKKRRRLGDSSPPMDDTASRGQGDDGKNKRPLDREGYASANTGSSSGEPSWWATEPDVGRVAHGIPSRVDRLRGLGNAVVPQVAQWIGERILEFDE